LSEGQRGTGHAHETPNQADDYFCPHIASVQLLIFRAKPKIPHFASQPILVDIDFLASFTVSRRAQHLRRVRIVKPQPI
jgi:hypothetical protein